MSSFKNLEPKDNFYQTSLFFPMPVAVVSTLTEKGETTLGSYSLIAPYYIAGKEYYAMILECRNSSNTAQNIIKTGKCAINFFPDDRKYFKQAVALGWPGDTPEEKMKRNTEFHLEKGQMEDIEKGEKRPLVVTESFQVIECTWMKELDNGEDAKPLEEGKDHYEGPFHDFNGITSPYGAHFILKVDRILMKEKYRNTIVNGVTAKGFPRVPVDYGYRDSKNFWYTKFKKPIGELLPQRETSLST